MKNYHRYCLPFCEFWTDTQVEHEHMITNCHVTFPPKKQSQQFINIPNSDSAFCLAFLPLFWTGFWHDGLNYLIECTHWIWCNVFCIMKLSSAFTPDCFTSQIEIGFWTAVVHLEFNLWILTSIWLHKISLREKTVKRQSWKRIIILNFRYFRVSDHEVRIIQFLLCVVEQGGPWYRRHCLNHSILLVLLKTKINYC